MGRNVGYGSAQDGWYRLCRLELAARGPLTLVYAARDEQQNNARVLAEWLEEELARRDEPSSPTGYAGERMA